MITAMTMARRPWSLSFLALGPVTSLLQDQSPDPFDGEQREAAPSSQPWDGKSGRAVLPASYFSHVDPAPECVKALIFCELLIQNSLDFIQALDFYKNIKRNLFTHDKMSSSPGSPTTFSPDENSLYSPATWKPRFLFEMKGLILGYDPDVSYSHRKR